MSARRHLPDRRGSETFSFGCGSFIDTATVSRFPDGGLAEIFISNGKAGSASDINARDAAIVASIALQFGVPADVIRHALTRNTDGTGGSPLAAALDLISNMNA
jgi:ribonucleoside-diphosphate reductase alpha chain